jgi:ElaB/YqjD/DUF883 family membrane-anchored ribosome-binding protein
MSEENAESRADRLLRELLGDTKVGPTVRAKAKELYPDVSFVEDKIDPIAEQLRAENAKLREEWETERAARASEKAAAEEAAAKQRMEASLSEAKAKFGLTEDGFNQMVERMRETGNYTDALGAAAYVVSQAPKPKAPGPTFGPQALNLFGSQRDTGAEGMKFLHTDPLGFQDAQLAAFVQDPDGFVNGTAGY